MKPLSTYYSEEVKKWLRVHPGRVVAQEDIAGLFVEAFYRTATIKIAMNSFQTTGIWPTNRDFIVASVTNIEMPSSQDQNNIASATDFSAPSQNIVDATGLLSAQQDAELLETLRPLGNVDCTEMQGPSHQAIEVLQTPDPSQHLSNLHLLEAEEAYNVPIAVIYHRIKGRKNPVTILSTGRRPALPADVEETIANCLIARARMGWPSDEKELCNLVNEYVITKNLKTPFKNNIPGHDWYLSFMKRHPNLSFKKPEHLQKIRKDARDPFVVYDFYKKLQDLITEKSLEYPNKSCFMFNADESGFSSDPSRVRAIGEKGKTVSRVSGGSGRESTTVLACIAANGSYLPPFIAFKGSAVQARWTSEQAIGGTLYGASKNGWMEEPHSYHWFETSFIPEVKTRRLRYDLPNQTAILLFEGHCSHVGVRIVNSALKDNVALFRFPSHLTDRIQPLDKCVFGPIKIKWDKILVAHGKSEMGKSSGRLSKQKFVELLSEVWREGIPSTNIISGFKTTGIFPVNPDMFSEEFFDPLKLEKYKKSMRTVSLGIQCPPEPMEPTPGTSSIEANDTPCTNENPTVQVFIPQKHSPNHILHIFSKKLQEASTKNASKILANPGKVNIFEKP
ncbi:hypothetical protein MML48_6g00008638 [Holotrichia oblita]|uniref:Uncharacterized protein n=1 Tax=Holotrichia oblita TaxID=644536 RepID=A0ACB9SZU7_HOLOL|nr:hypothetical protein MML48_6g00008638 [Holotrichia oblita]